MTALAISLRALRHPLTLTSIGLLLLNDHVLKVVMPSPLPGRQATEPRGHDTCR